MITFPLVTYDIYHNFKHKNKFIFYTYNSSICYITYTTPIHILELQKKNQILIEQLEEKFGIRN
jgi:hypothetical protein